MSKRENIASDIITKLDAVTSPIEFKKITREPFEVEELSDAQFPALFVQSGDETREVASIGVTGSGTYNGTIDFLIVAVFTFSFEIRSTFSKLFLLIISDKYSLEPSVA